MSIETILAGISTAEKLLPVIESVGKEIGPLVNTEIADGKAILADIEKAFNDLKAGFSSLKTVAQSAQSK